MYEQGNMRDMPATTGLQGLANDRRRVETSGFIEKAPPPPVTLRSATTEAHGQVDELEKALQELDCYLAPLSMQSPSNAASGVEISERCAPDAVAGVLALATRIRHIRVRLSDLGASLRI